MSRLLSLGDLKIGRSYEFKFRTANNGESKDSGVFTGTFVEGDTVWYHFKTSHVQSDEGIPYEHDCFLEIREVS